MSNEQNGNSKKNQNRREDTNSILDSQGAGTPEGGNSNGNNANNNNSSNNN